MTDVHLANTADGGEIQFINGKIVTSDGLASAAYISLFGGNEQDSGSEADDTKQWWGNLTEDIEDRIQRSETQNLLFQLPAIPANLRLVEAAVQKDCAWMLGDFASEVSAIGSMPAMNRIAIELAIIVGDSRYEFAFEESWGKT